MKIFDSTILFFLLRYTCAHNHQQAEKGEIYHSNISSKATTFSPTTVAQNDEIQSVKSIKSPLKPTIKTTNGSVTSMTPNSTETGTSG